MDMLQCFIRKVTRKPAVPLLTVDTTAAPWSTFGVLPQPQQPIMYHHHPQLQQPLLQQPLLQQPPLQQPLLMQWHWQQPPQYSCHYYPRQPISACPLIPSCA
jgi:hypothetical protein